MFQKIINKLNDLRPRQLLMLAGLAAILMFLTLYVAMSFFAKEEVVITEDNKPPIETTPVVVAKINITPRTRIQDSMLQIKEMPNDLIPDGAIRSFDDVRDIQVKVSIFAGDVLTIQKVFAERAEEAGFVGTIPSDCRAVSISVNDITGVAGFAKPGDYVDLLLAEKSPYSATTTMLLQNVPLLSINQDMTGTSVVEETGVANATAAISSPTIATFALNPEDTLKLISATKLGEIYMSLRPTNPQNSYVAAMEYTLDSVNMPPPETKTETPMPVIPENPPPAVPLPQLPMTPPVPKIEIIQGDEVTQKAEENVMPMIPSGAAPIPSSPVASRPTSTSQVAQPLENTPLSNSRVASSFRD